MTHPHVIGILNGPNLNLLGEREPDLYGTGSLDDLQARCVRTADGLGYGVDFHTSVAVRDALVTVAAPVVEVHLTNVHRREEFRRTSYIADVVDAVIVGCGPAGYEYALQHLAQLVDGHAATRGTSLAPV